MSTTHAVLKTPDARHVPPVLPVLAMTIAADGTMTVAVDGRRLEPPRFSPPWVRSSFAAIIDSVLEDRGSPVRVLVYETDGTVFTDLITRPLQRELDPTVQPPQREESAVGPTRTADALVEAAPFIAPPRIVVGVDGFIPGEDVAVAIIVRHTKAATDGSARALLEPGLCQISATGEIVLVGLISGTCVVGDLT